MLKEGVGDHPAERCAPHEVEQALGFYKALCAQQHVEEIKANALAAASQFERFSRRLKR